MNRMRDIGARVFELREQLDWSQMKLAEEAGVSHTTIVHVETGQVTPRPSTLRRIARGFGISVEDLTGEVTPKLAAPLVEAPPAPADPEERRLVALTRPLMAIMDSHIETWEQLASRGAVFPNDLRKVLVARRETVEMVSELIGALIEQGLLVDDPRHRPSRRTWHKLKVAYIRWDRAFLSVREAHFEHEMESVSPSAEERSVAAWFDQVA